MNVISPKDLEEICRLSILLTNICLFALMTPIKIVGLYTLFLQLEKSTNPHHLQVQNRRQAFTKRMRMVAPASC